MKDKIKTALIISNVFGILSMIIGLLSLIISNPENFSDTGVFVALTTIVIPVFSIVISLSILLHQFDADRKEMLVSNKKFLIELTPNFIVQSSDSINMQKILQSPHREILLTCLTDLISDVHRQVQELSDGHYYEYDPKKYHDFVKRIFGFAKDTEEIKATSIVDPNTFWNDPKIHAYLSFQERLINEKMVRITRFFFFNKADKDKYAHAIAINLQHGINVRIVPLDNIVDKYPDFIADGGAVGNKIAIKCDVDPISKTINRVDCWIGNAPQIEEVNTWLECLASESKSVTEIFSKTVNEMVTEFA